MMLHLGLLGCACVFWPPGDVCLYTGILWISALQSEKLKAIQITWRRVSNAELIVVVQHKY